MTLNVKCKERILIVNPFGIGDVLFTTPIIEAIKSEVPRSYVGYLCNRRTAPLILSNPKVDKVFIFEKDEYRKLWRNSKIRTISQLCGLLKEIKREKFDIVFDLSLAQEFGLLLAVAGIRERIGYNYRKRGIFLTKKVALENAYSERHMVDYYIGLLPLAGIKKPAKPELKIYISEQDRTKATDILKRKGIAENERFVCIVPGAGASWGITSFRKQWPKEHFAKLAKSICRENTVKSALLGSTGEKPLCDYIENQESSCINLCGETELSVFAAMIAKSELLITNDGGPLHIAVAAGTKTVSIFGPVDDKVYGPYPPGTNHIVVRNESIDCRPCYKGFKLPDCTDRKCLEGISPELVMSKGVRHFWQGV